MASNLHISLTPFRNESRVLKETASIVRHGIATRVVVVALHEPGLPERETIDAKRRIVRIRLLSRSWSRSHLIQLFKYVEFAYRTVSVARKEKASIINVHSVALLPIGALLKLVCRAKLIYDAHELETETNELHGLRKCGAKLIERLLIRYADLTIVVSPSIEQWYRREYPDIPVVTILNVPPMAPRLRSARLRDELGIPADRRIALYQGGLSPNRGIPELLSAAHRLGEAGYALVFMGYGPCEEAIKAAHQQNSNIYLRPAVSSDLLMSYTQSADLGFSWIVGNCLSYRFCLPNKMFEYIMAGVPVIASDLPEMARVIDDAQIGVCLEDWQPANLAAALARIDVMRRKGLDLRLSEAARRYCWESQEAALVAAYETHVITFAR